MGKSLSAQLLQAGLVSKKQANKAKHEQYKKKKKKGGKHKAVSESTQHAQKALAAEKEQARQLNRQQKLQKEQKELMAQIGQMIGSAKMKIGKGDQAYNFADNNKIRKIYVTEPLRDQLSKGQVAIVKHKEQYEIVPAEVARKIAKRNAEAVLVLNESQQKNDPDDPYAEFPVPDDLDW